MKTTKVLGIVLGTLLVAGLFVGAAAAHEDVYLGTKYAYVVYGNQLATNVTIEGNEIWTDAAGNSVTFLPDDVTDGTDNYYIDGANVAAEGDYYVGIGGTKYYITVKMPTAAISGAVYEKVNDHNPVSALIGSTVMNDKVIKIDQDEGKYAFTNPEGTLTSINATAVGLTLNAPNGLKGADLGEWTVQAYFEKGNNNNLLHAMISQFAPDFVLGKPYYFTVVSSDTSKKVVALTPEIIQGGYATIEVTAPTGVWDIAVSDGAVPAGQPLVEYPTGDDAKIGDKNHYTLTIGASGVGTFTVTTTKSSNIKVELLDKKTATPSYAVLKSVTVKVKSGAITATTEDASVFIGNEFDVDGTNDIGGSVYFFIKGTNYKFQPIYTATVESGEQNVTKILTASGKIWSETVDTAFIVNDGKKPDAGTYTIYVASLSDAFKPDGTFIDDLGNPLQIANIWGLDYDDMDDSDYVKAYATVSVALKQPFITITKAPEVLVQGEKLVVEGTAEGEPKNVQYYIFGTNKFIFGSEAVTDGAFTIEIKKDYTKKESMAAGQYFLVIQHPMYDKVFNIGANAIKLGTANEQTYPNKGYAVGDVILNKNGAWNDKDAGNNTLTVVFNTNNRQSANAAQALCDNLDNQDIDDMYAKASFIVAGPTSYIDAIPSQITKGQVLTISGTTTGHKDDVVTVELLSTAFAAIPKEAVGSASFVALTTKIGEDGVWSISFDTSNLNADEYTCSVAVGQLDATSSKVTIVEGAGPQPTQTAGPVTPTAQPTAQPTATPATPGFGALAALAGLGAVAVLLLRRQ